MALLDVFQIVFQSNSSEAVQGLAQVDKASKGVEKSLQSAAEASAAIAKKLAAASIEAAEEVVRANADAASAVTDADKKAAEQRKKLAEFVAKSSSDAYKKAAAEAEAAAQKASESTKSKLSGTIDRIGKKLGVLAAGWLSVNAAMSRVAEVNAISQTADTIGDSVQNVDAFGKAILEVGGDAQGARDTLTDLAESMGEALKDKESGRAKSFKELGITLTTTKRSASEIKAEIASLESSMSDMNKRDYSDKIKKLNDELSSTKPRAKGVTDTMLDLASAVEGMSKQEAVFKIKELGITDNRSVELILKGRKELERLLKVQKDQGVISNETSASTRKFTDSLNRLKGAVVNSSSGFLDALMPALTKGLDWLNKIVDWAQDNKDLVTGFFIAVAAVVTAVYAPAMIAAAAATLAATLPIVAIGVAIAAGAALFALIYDDIMNFIEGNDSLIGQMMENYPEIAKLIFTVIDAFKAFGGIVGEVMSSTWQVVKDTVGFMIDAIGGLMKVLGGAASAVATVGKVIFGGSSSETNGVGKVYGSIGVGKSALATANADPMNSTTSNAISNQSNVKSESNVSVGQVTIQAGQATDAKGIAAALPSELPKQIKQLKAENATGVAR